MDNENTEALTDSLSNIPGIGPARKAALYAAGITTRAALAEASIDQIVGLTGMPRAQAEKALESLQSEPIALSAPSPQTAPPLQDEAMPSAPSIDLPDRSPVEVPSLPDDDQNPEIAVRGMLGNAAFRTKTALADATRVWSLPKLIKPLGKLASSLEVLTEQAIGDIRPKAATRLALRLEKLSTWIERAIAENTDNKALKEKQKARVRQRLKSERIKLEQAILTIPKRRTNKKTEKTKKSALPVHELRQKKRRKKS